LLTEQKKHEKAEIARKDLMAQHLEDAAALEEMQERLSFVTEAKRLESLRREDSATQVKNIQKDLNARNNDYQALQVIMQCKLKQEQQEHLVTKQTLAEVQADPTGERQSIERLQKRLAEKDEQLKEALRNASVNEQRQVKSQQELQAVRTSVASPSSRSLREWMRCPPRSGDAHLAGLCDPIGLLHHPILSASAWKKCYGSHGEKA